MSQFPFIGASYKDRSRNFDYQECINLFPSMGESGSSKNVMALYGTPGLRPWVSLPAAAAVRGEITFSPTQGVVVCGTTVYTVATDGTYSAISAISAGSTPVSMASNGTVIMLVTGLANDGYVINPTLGTVTQITNPAFMGATTVRFVDGYFLFNTLGTGRFQITGFDGISIDSLDFATAEGSPDDIVGIETNHREVWLLGEDSTEVWYNNGNGDFPFGRIEGAFLEQGCAAPYSIAKMDSSIFWLTLDDRGQGMVARSAGYDWQRVSTHSIEYEIAQMSRIDDAVAYSYQQEGHTFYVLTFPTGNKTFVYDAATQMWHERAWRKPADNSMNRHRSNCRMQFAGKTIVGDFENGKLYELDMDYFKDDQDVIPRIRSCPHAKSSDYHNLFFASLQIDMQTGVGLTSGQGADPQAMLQWSDDGGFSWSAEKWASFGKIGKRRTRVRWRRLGKSRDRVFRVTITDPVRVVIIGAAAEITEGAS